VDERPYSPATATRKYEEAVARQSGGDVPGGGSPTDLISMSAFPKPQQAQLPGRWCTGGTESLGGQARGAVTDLMPGVGRLPAFDSSRQYQDVGAYPQYSAQPYPAQAAQNAEQINQDSFAANTASAAAAAAAAAAVAVGQYMAAPPAGMQPTILSSDPASGSYGTKVSVKLSFAFDVLSMSQPGPYFYILFGSQKVQAAVMDDSRDTGFVCTISVQAPQHMMTGCQTASVPLTLVVESAGGEEMAKVGVGEFLYHDAQAGHGHGHGGQAPEAASTSATTGAVGGGVGSVGSVGSVGHVGVGGAAGNPDEITRRGQKSPVQNNAENAPKTHLAQIVHETTNTYEYPGPAAQQQSAQSQYATAFPQPAGNNTMITAYRTATYTDHYPRPPPPALRSPGGWPTYAPYETPRSPAQPHPSIPTRPSLNPLPISGGIGAPQLIRTSTLQANMGGNGYPYALYPNKAVLSLQGSLDSMADNWSQEEMTQRRRLVLFKKTQSGSTLNVSFRPVKISERPPQSICISCIWWREKSECYVTSVDTILLLEQLLVAPGRFTVEEKNRIRRNLEGFHPSTVSKTKHESEDFFKLIMAFGNPKPRNIEKDVKVFPWKVLGTALNKIIGKYSASPSSTVPPSHSMAAPAYQPASYPPLPTPPLTSGPGLPDASAAYAAHASSYHDSLASPRSISGGSSSWGPHSAAPSHRALSPSLRTASPQSSLRLSSLPTVSTYDSRSIPAGAYGSSAGHHTPIGHQPSATPPRWEALHSTYPEYPSIHSHHSSSHQVYSTGTAYDGAPRA
jgi:hypothetical protein